MAPEYEIRINITANSREEAYRLARDMAANSENIEVAEPHIRSKQSRNPLYLQQKELITDYLCGCETLTINPRSIKLYIEQNGDMHIKVKKIKIILDDLKSEGYKIPPYATDHRKIDQPAIADEPKIEDFKETPKPEPDPILKEELIQSIGELWKTHHSVSKIQKILNHKNNGIISVTEALQILEERKTIPSLKSTIKQRPLRLDLTPIEEKLPTDFRIIRKNYTE